MSESYDLFISFSGKDRDLVANEKDKLEQCGIKVYWSEERCKEVQGKAYAPGIIEALHKSQHFLLFATPNIEGSEWIIEECTSFYSACYMKDRANRRFYVYPTKKPNSEYYPAVINNIIQISDSIENIIKDIVTLKSKHISRLEDVLLSTIEFYGHYRFWDKICTEASPIHIITCARPSDVNQGDVHKGDRLRGSGRTGRTNIDMWDYQTVVDLAHFLGAKYPNNHVTFDEPVSKATSKQIVDVDEREGLLEKVTARIKGKDCIIVGSPDVSDFAEYVLAKVHVIKPFSARRIKKRGFVIIKEKQISVSSFYWEKKEDEEEGVILIDSKGNHLNFDLNCEVNDTMHGILTVVNNPFLSESPENARKILILSGFSGVATNAIAKILTDDKYLSEFYKLDQAIGEMTNFEAVISVKYSTDSADSGADTRTISNEKDAIKFEMIVEI